MRSEYGSEHYLLDYGPGGRIENPWDELARSYASGRDALRSLLHHGQERLGWRRLWVPSYFCQEVVASLCRTGIPIVPYDDAPVDASYPRELRDARAGDIMLNVNFMGLRLWREPGFYGALEVIEDHTHDPWSAWAYTSSADWCVASLRKTLPIPDGAVLWSPTGRALPAPLKCTEERSHASLRKMAGMVLKKRYLAGDDISKADFLELYRAGEAQISSHDPSGISEWSRNLLNTFPIQEWRRKRLDNYRAFAKALGNSPFVRLVAPESQSSSCPFSCLMLFDSPARRDFVRKRLLDRDVYPSVLWPLHEPAIQGIPAMHEQLGRKVLSIHCDMRCDEDDMAVIAGIVTNAVRESAAK